mmetsp:Transcript_15665/g.36978  ORF Transcript_15665/g.36978 Transcript_15665/m.36978 type:complete len:261 (+) Transcript_15665:1866-2648(+)
MSAVCSLPVVSSLPRARHSLRRSASQVRIRGGEPMTFGGGGHNAMATSAQTSSAEQDWGLFSLSHTLESAARPVSKTAPSSSRGEALSPRGHASRNRTAIRARPFKSVLRASAVAALWICRSVSGATELGSNTGPHATMTATPSASIATASTGSPPHETPAECNVETDRAICRRSTISCLPGALPPCASNISARGMIPLVRLEMWRGASTPSPPGSDLITGTKGRHSLLSDESPSSSPHERRKTREGAAHARYRRTRVSW